MRINIEINPAGKQWLRLDRNGKIASIDWDICETIADQARAKMRVGGVVEIGELAALLCVAMREYILTIEQPEIKQ